jgi:hypothetical protein
MYTDFMAFMRKSGKLSDDLEAEMQVEVRASPRLASACQALEPRVPGAASHLT